MKQTSFIGILILCLSFVSCNEISDTPLDKENALKLTSEMSQQQFYQTCETIGSSNISRASQDEESCKKMVSPLVNDGKILQQQILTQISSTSTLKKEVDFYQSLSDDELASLSFVYHALNAEGINTKDFDDKISKLNPSQGRLLHCLSVAVGYDAFSKLGVGGIINAVTVRQVIIAIGKRYIGYVGVAIMVYEFTNCVR